ncbi:MAG: hypothetical protein K0S92_794 [Desertimonas sp.]|jgi:hypothetical protein|nr:hypothetical protein [Desertimonas sp.]
MTDLRLYWTELTRRIIEVWDRYDERCGSRPTD